MPKVSVIIPAYNVGPYIEETLQSVFRQTFTDYEVIVVDDGSTDDIKNKIRPYMGKIKYIYQKNKGLAGARNTGIKVAKGDYIALLDGDDIWLRQYLEEHLKEIEKDSKIGIVFADAFRLQDGKLLQKKYKEINPVPKKIGFSELLRRNFVFGLSLVRRKVFSECGLFDESFRCAEDYDMWLRAAKTGYKIGFIDKPLSIYRQRKESLSRNPIKMYSTLIMMYKKLLEHENISDSEKRAIQRIKSGYQFKLGCEFLAIGNIPMAKRNFHQSFLTDPWSIYSIMALKFFIASPTLLKVLYLFFRKIKKRP